MTTKKKVGISDLLRDEVQKGLESPVSSAVNNEPVEKTIEVKAETVSDAVSQVTGQSPNKAIAPSSKSADPITADRDRVKIEALESELGRSQQREADLQKDLKFSQTNVELLQKSLAAIENLKNELDQQLVAVKRDNLRLAEANIQLSEQLSQQSKVKEISKVTTETSGASQLVTQNNQQNNNRATPRKQPSEQPYPNRDRTPYTRPTGSNEHLQRINNKNIGWMD